MNQQAKSKKKARSKPRTRSVRDSVAAAIELHRQGDVEGAVELRKEAGKWVAGTLTTARKLA